MKVTGVDELRLALERLTQNGVLSPNELVRSYQRGLANAHRPMILERGIRFETVQLRDHRCEYCGRHPRSLVENCLGCGAPP